MKSLPVTAEIATVAGQLSEEGFHGDPADRLIAATAIVNSCPLLTKDKRIRASKEVHSIW